MARTDSLSFVMVLFKKVLIFYKVEKHRSGSAVAIKVTTRILSNFKVSKKTLCKLSCAIVLLKLRALEIEQPPLLLQSSLIFSIQYNEIYFWLLGHFLFVLI